MNTAKKLTLDEIKALPRASVIWSSFVFNTDEGIQFHTVYPVMVCVPHENGCLIGGDEEIYLRWIIDNQLMENDVTFWDIEPARDQLPGITQNEYDGLPDVKRIILAAAITSKGYSFESFSMTAGLSLDRLRESLNGQREFTLDEMEKISKVLEFSDDQIREVFFPAAAKEV